MLKIIRTKLAEKFPEVKVDALSDEEIIQGVAWPGFSSRDEVGEFSGRGVGLDALRTEVLKVNGLFRIESQVGQGTKILISLPQALGKADALRSVA
jgi:two-component system chemotaxis sensor kinase CheA